jgi:hypothetical protein
VNGRIGNTLLQQREIAGHLSQHLIDPTIAHHHLQQLRGRLDLAAAGKRLIPFPGNNTLK